MSPELKLLIQLAEKKFGRVCSSIIFLCSLRDVVALKDLKNDLYSCDGLPPEFRLSEILSDGELKQCVVSLFQHKVLTQSMQGVHLNQPLEALWHIYFFSIVGLPILKKSISPGAGTLVEILHEYGTLTTGSLLSMASQPSSNQTELSELCTMGIVTVVSEKKSSDKKIRSEGVADSSLTKMIALDHYNILHFLRGMKIQRFVCNYFADPLVERIVEHLVLTGGKVLSTSAAAPPCPSLAPKAISDEMKKLSFRCDEGVVSNMLATLARPTVHLPVPFVGAQTSKDMNFTYNLSYDGARMSIGCREAESIVGSRFGRLGLRILKLLSLKGAMEDRLIAEECICTLQQARELLRSMLRESVVKQQFDSCNGVETRAASPKWKTDFATILNFARDRALTAFGNALLFQGFLHKEANTAESSQLNQHLGLMCESLYVLCFL